MVVSNTKKVYTGRRFNVLRVLYRINGSQHIGEVVDFGNAVAILPFTNDGKIIMLRQYRVAINKWIYEIPAGKVEESESPEETAVREMIEETGYRPGRLIKLITIYPSPGYSNEILHIFEARDLTYIGAKREEDELINVIVMDYNEALNRVLSEEVADGKTLIALLYYAYKHGIRLTF
ncbi:MAG: NUDIX hydrolase [Thermoprotei archaeon]|nr:MAG: NUDIX hydrolase [Thermoprotei archaeon]